jgi:hypothetical protein
VQFDHRLNLTLGGDGTGAMIWLRAVHLAGGLLPAVGEDLGFTADSVPFHFVLTPSIRGDTHRIPLIPVAGFRRVRHKLEEVWIPPVELDVPPAASARAVR